MSETYRILLADDHVLVAEGIQKLLEPEYELVGIVADGRSLVAAAAKLHPDIVVVDISLPLLNGLDASQQLKKNNPNLKIIVLTMHSDDAHLRHALNAGARGYLLKDAEPDAIIRAIVAVSEGQAIFDPGIAARVIAATGAPQADRPFPVLTEREHEILDRLARGLRNDAIAARMGISIKTVQNNVSTILLKLGATDRAQAVALARDAGMGQRP